MIQGTCHRTQRIVWRISLRSGRQKKVITNGTRLPGFHTLQSVGLHAGMLFLSNTHFLHLCPWENDSTCLTESFQVLREAGWLSGLNKWSLLLFLPESLDSQWGAFKTCCLWRLFWLWLFEICPCRSAICQQEFTDYFKLPICVTKCETENCLLCHFWHMAKQRVLCLLRNKGVVKKILLKFNFYFY